MNDQLLAELIYVMSTGTPYARVRKVGRALAHLERAHKDKGKELWRTWITGSDDEEVVRGRDALGIVDPELPDE